MAYGGAIRYIEPDKSNVEWWDDVTWPRPPPPPSQPESMPVLDAPSTSSGNQRGEGDAGAAALELMAPVWGLAPLRCDDLFLDDGSPTVHPASKCVIIGMSKHVEEGRRKYYIMVVGLLVALSRPLEEYGRGSEWESLRVGTSRWMGRRRWLVSGEREAQGVGETSCQEPSCVLSFGFPLDSGPRYA